MPFEQWVKPVKETKVAPEKKYYVSVSPRGTIGLGADVCKLAKVEGPDDTGAAVLYIDSGERVGIKLRSTNGLANTVPVNVHKKGEVVRILINSVDFIKDIGLYDKKGKTLRLECKLEKGMIVFDLPKKAEPAIELEPLPDPDYNKPYTSDDDQNHIPFVTLPPSTTPEDLGLKPFPPPQHPGEYSRLDRWRIPGSMEVTPRGVNTKLNPAATPPATVTCEANGASNAS